MATKINARYLKDEVATKFQQQDDDNTSAASDTTPEKSSPPPGVVVVATSKQLPKAADLPFFASTIRQHLVMTVFTLLSFAAVTQSPFVADTLNQTLSFVHDTHFGTYGFQPLTPLCWLAHAPFMSLGLELVLSCLRLRHNSPFWHSMAIINGMNLFQGFMILLNHVLVGDAHDQLEETLWKFGGGFLVAVPVFSTGCVGLFPKNYYGWLLFPFVVYGVGTGTVTFRSPMGGVLSLLSMAAMLLSKESTKTFKLGYIMTVLSPALSPPSSTDWGHSIGATMLNVSIAVMVLGLKMDSHYEAIMSTFQKLNPWLVEPKKTL